MDATALLKRERLVAARPGTEQGSDLITEATKASGALTVFEPTHGPVALYNVPMVLLHMVMQVTVHPGDHVVPEDVPDGTRVCLMAIRGDAIWGDTGHGPGGAKKGLSGC